MSKRYGKDKEGKHRCEVCEKVMRNVTEKEIRWVDNKPILTGEEVLVRRCLNPECAKYYYRKQEPEPGGVVGNDRVTVEAVETVENPKVAGQPLGLAEEKVV